MSIENELSNYCNLIKIMWHSIECFFTVKYYNFIFLGRPVVSFVELISYSSHAATVTNMSYCHM